jgi:hypothetical protein
MFGIALEDRAFVYRKSLKELFRENLICKLSFEHSFEPSFKAKKCFTRFSLNQYFFFPEKYFEIFKTLLSSFTQFQICSNAKNYTFIPLLSHTADMKVQSTFSQIIRCYQFSGTKNCESSGTTIELWSSQIKWLRDLVIFL